MPPRAQRTPVKQSASRRTAKRKRVATPSPSDDSDNGDSPASPQEGGADSVSSPNANDDKVKDEDSRLSRNKTQDVFSVFHRMLKKGWNSAEPVLARCLAIKIGTMCSGTDAPVIALREIASALHYMTNGTAVLRYEQAFTWEKEPFKQAFLERNSDAKVNFRDLEDLLIGDDGAVPTQAYAVATWPHLLYNEMLTDLV